MDLLTHTQLPRALALNQLLRPGPHTRVNSLASSHEAVTSLKLLNSLGSTRAPTATPSNALNPRTPWVHLTPSTPPLDPTRPSYAPDNNNPSPTLSVPLAAVAGTLRRRALALLPSPPRIRRQPQAEVDPNGRRYPSTAAAAAQPRCPPNDARPLFRESRAPDALLLSPLRRKERVDWDGMACVIPVRTYILTALPAPFPPFSPIPYTLLSGLPPSPFDLSLRGTISSSVPISISPRKVFVPCVRATAAIEYGPWLVI
ncbi:hypothetical protein B0H16DRAFT_1723264 [Mycena metata]|uniref:Uncharacterized protein n=1 Tax=Mycena metata TaxID=1033252 RepID=A0AAD7J0C1_9AGAR|nr:hypothetical protein B0H16DRAFT_1723264 [Mycena metata]